MGKFFLIAACLLGAALYFPSTRGPVLEFLSPVLRPVFTWSTNGELRTIAGDLTEHERIFRTIPARAREFEAWMSEQYQGEDAMTDSWGQTYRIQVWPDSFAIISDGPDRQTNTEDDLRAIGQREHGRSR